MPIGRIVKETLGTLAEEALKEAPEAIAKKAPRKVFKELAEVPEEIRILPPEERVKAVDKFFKEEKVEEFARVRKEDILKEERIAYAEKVKTKEQLEEIKFDKEIFAKYLSEEKKLTQEDRITMLQERQRDLYLKADKLKKEQENISLYQANRAEGIESQDSIAARIATTPGAGKNFSSIEGMSTAIYNRVSADMFELKEGMRTKWLGIKQDTELGNEVIRYLKDGQIKNTARLTEVKQIADQWIKASDKIKGLRNRAGARIGKLEDWILPQSHDAQKIRKVGFEKWSYSIRDKLDKARIEAEQGRRLEDVLEDAYKNITTPQVEMTGGRGTGILAKRGEAHRILHFKSGDDMINYKNEFGNPDTFSTMDAHIRQQSNEIAVLKLFGSNPEDTFNKMKEMALADGMGTDKVEKLDALWRISTGQADGDAILDSRDALIAAIGGTHRALKSAGSLGTAQITAIGDVGNMILGSGYRGLKTIRLLGKSLHTLIQEATTIGGTAMNTQIANRIGVVSEFASASLANSRYAEVGTGWAQKAAEIVIRGSGLGAYTTSMRTAVGLELAGNFAENFGKKLDDTPFWKLFEEYGITSKEWDIIRKTKARDMDGAKFLDMNKIYEVDEELGYRINEMITNEMDAFVIMPTDRTRLYTTWGAKKGTMKGEAARNIFLFKSFPIAVFMMHTRRIGKIDTTMGKAAYGAALLGTSTILGGITLMAYDIVTGKTPRDIKGREKEFVIESVLKSGGLGIFADLTVGADTDRYGHSYITTLVGVPAGTIEDISKVMGTIKDPLSRERWAHNYNMAKQYIPGQNLWYTRAVMERTLGEFFGEQIDPNYKKRVRRREKYMKQRGQEFLLK